MFESNTYDAIMERVMDRMPSDIHHDEGSFLYTAAGPVGIEHEQIYASLDHVLSEAFIPSASMEYLQHFGEVYGITPHKATPAVWAAVVSPAAMSTRIGERFNCGDMNLVVTGQQSEGVWELTCETAGAEGNTLNADLVPISYIYGLESIYLSELLTAGSDDETADEYRARLLFHVQKPVASGNANSYIEWATSVDGVGAAKVFPLWAGNGTVKVVITDSDKRAAPAALVREVFEYIEEERPIGATVTVTSGTELPINVSAVLTLKSGYVASVVNEAFARRLTEYLEATAYTIDYLPISVVGCILLNTDGVEDYADLRINDGTENIDLSAEQIAVIGTIRTEVRN